MCFYDFYDFSLQDVRYTQYTEKESEALRSLFPPQILSLSFLAENGVCKSRSFTSLPSTWCRPC